MSRLRRTLGNDAAPECCHRPGREPLDDLPIGHHGTDTEAGETQPLGEAVNCNRALRIEARGENMIIREIPIGAIMQDVGACLARDVAKCPYLVGSVANPKRIIGIDQIDYPRILIHRRAQLLRRQPIPRGRIVDRDFAHFGTGLPRKLHRPFPARIGRYEIGARFAVGPAYGRKRGDGAFCDESRRRFMRQPEVGDDAVQQGGEAAGRRVGMKFFRLDRIDQRLPHRWVHRQMIGVLAQPEQVLRGEKAIEMSVALLKAAHCRFGRGLMTEPYPAMPPSTVTMVPVM